MRCPFLHYHKNQGEHGYTPNFENALRLAKGDYIFLADQDDVWLPNKVSRCLEELRNCSFVVSDAFVTDDKLNIIRNSYFKERGINRSLAGNIIKFGFLGCCMAFKQEVLKKALPFPHNHHLCTHDNWLFISSASFFKYNIIDEKLVYYRRHYNNTSKWDSPWRRTTFFRLKYRLYLVYHLIKRTLSSR